MRPMLARPLFAALTLALVAAPALACAPPTSAPVAVSPAGPNGFADAGGRRHRLVALDGPDAVDLARPVAIMIIAEADRHGRLPVLAFREGEPIEREAIAAGRARFRPHPALDEACSRLLSRAEAEAIRARRGLWAEPGAVLAADDAAGLAGADGQRVAVEGRVRSVRRAGRITYVNFGPPGAGALTVTLDDRIVASFRAIGLEPAAFPRQVVVARGRIEVRRGPTIAAATVWALIPNAAGATADRDPVRAR